MATNYPASSDVFNVPTSPSTTPLSSAGTGSRNHVSHHRDLGDAVMALQDNAAQITHTHDGTGLNSPKLLQVNTHQSPDTDVAANSLHHTIGTSATQAAAGNHNHDTRYIRLDGSIDQTVTGKKTFPSGSDAIAIPDFTNSAHSHANTAGGGVAAAGGDTVGYRYFTGGPAGATSAIVSDVTKDFYVHTNRFTVPANMGAYGYLAISYVLKWGNTSSPPSSAGWGYQAQTRHSAKFYISYNNGESPAFSTSKNILIAGGAFNGAAYMVNHQFSTVVGTHDFRIDRLIPWSIPPLTTARTNTAIVLRVVNDEYPWMFEFNTGLAFHFVSFNYTNLV